MSVNELTVAVIAGMALSHVIRVVSNYVKDYSDNRLAKKLEEVDCKLKEMDEKLKEVDSKIIEVDRKTEGVDGIRKIVVSSAHTSKGNYKTLQGF
jgi:thymidine phosphorylase